MTREQAKKNLIAFGIEEPSEEQISNYLNQIGTETKKEKERADGYKASADKAAELQAELDRINAEKMSEDEKTKAELEKANNRIAELEKTQAIANQRSLAMEKFRVDAEQAKQIVKDDGSFDYDILGQIISNKEAAAATAKEQEIAKNATNPGGQSGGGSENNIANDMAKAAAKRAGTANESILKNYRR